MISALMAIVGLGGGIIVGGAIAAFISLLGIIPRLIQISRTHQYKILYQNAFISGATIFTIVYFFDFSIELSNVLVCIIGMIFGVFIGLFSSALAEVLNVIPVMSKKLKIKDDLKLIVYALLLGRVAGSLYYWLILK